MNTQIPIDINKMLDACRNNDSPNICRNCGVKIAQSKTELATKIFNKSGDLIGYEYICSNCGKQSYKCMMWREPDRHED